MNKAYAAFFNDLNTTGLSILRANASSGSMGGSHSHEYHLVSPNGEDEIISCQACGYCANAEVAERNQSVPKNAVSMPTFPMTELHLPLPSKDLQESGLHSQNFITQDGKTLIVAVIPQENHSKVNLHSVKREYPVDTGVEVRNFLGLFLRFWVVSRHLALSIM